MVIHASVQEWPDVSAQERALNDLVKLSRKLRWIGLEKEAEQMQSALRRVRPADYPLVSLYDAD